MTNTPIGAVFLPLLMLSGAALAADAVQGQILYQSTCARCHRADQGQLQTPPARIPETLRGVRISAHRFMLSDTDMDNLVDYLESRQGRP
jgi:mono/diheme cytochrome c family protein